MNIFENSLVVRTKVVIVDQIVSTFMGFKEGLSFVDQKRITIEIKNKERRERKAKLGF
jgi:hypothetical protein